MTIIKSMQLLDIVPARIREWVSGDLAAALLRTFLARGIAALGSLALVVVLGRLYGATGVGVFALAQGVIMGAGILSRYGMDNALMRFVGRDPESPQNLLYLRLGFTRAGVLSFCAALVIFVSRDFLERFFGAPGLGGVLVGIAIATPAFTLGFLLSGFFKGIRKPATACLLENGSIALIAALLVTVFYQVAPGAGLVAIGWAYALAAWLVLARGSWQLRNWHRHRQGDRPSMGTPAASREFGRSSGAFFVLSLANLMQGVLSILIAGWFLESADLGLFKSAQQTASLITFVLIVINAIFPPRFAEFYHRRDYRALEIYARRSAMVGISLALPLVLLCLAVPEWVLGLIGAEFRQAALLLRIVAVGQLINVATGSVGFLLNMTGNERLMTIIALTCGALGLAFFSLLTPFFGPLGAAVALALVLAIQNLAALVFVWRNLGIWMLPGPNLLRRVLPPKGT